MKRAVPRSLAAANVIELVFAHLATEGVAVDSERFGGARLIAVGALEGRLWWQPRQLPSICPSQVSSLSMNCGPFESAPAHLPLTLPSTGLRWRGRDVILPERRTETTGQESTMVTTGEVASATGFPEAVEASEAGNLYEPKSSGAAAPTPPPAVDP